MNAPGMRNDMTDLPAPLVAPDCDCSDLDSFMLNVERLMASELVARMRLLRPRCSFGAGHGSSHRLRACQTTIA